MVVSNGDDIDRIRPWMVGWQNGAELSGLGQRFAPMALMDLIVLQVKLAHIKKIIESRHKIKALYERELAGIEGLTIFQDNVQAESVAQNFVICCDRRDQLFDFLQSRGILAQRPYLPLHRTGIFEMIEKEFPVSEWYSKNALHLPLYSFMDESKAGTVVASCRDFFRSDQ